MKNKRFGLFIILLVLTFFVLMGIDFISTPYLNKHMHKTSKTWLCLGDSITLGETNRNVSYADYVGKLSGINLIKCGYSGYMVSSLLEELSAFTEDNLPDIVTIFIGTNDWVYSIPIGSKDDTDTTTFWGSMNQLAVLLTQKYQNARIYMFTPIYRNMRYNPAIPFTGTINANGNTIEDFASVIEECAENNHISVLDLYAESGITEKNINMVTNDGTHPNIFGHLKITRQVKKIINK